MIGIVWTCRIIIIAYGMLMLSSYWSQLTDLETTVRLVGSDVGCSLSLVDCNWFNFAFDKVVGIAAIGSGILAESWRAWRYRNRVLVGGAVLAIAHLAALRLLLNPS